MKKNKEPTTEEIIKAYDTNFGKLYYILTKAKKCFFCGKKMEISNKNNGGKIVFVSAYSVFSPKYLVHCQTTHGYTPDIMTFYIEEILKNIKNNKS